MYALSFYGGHDASVCLLKDGKILAHLEVERLTRVKGQSGEALTTQPSSRGKPWEKLGISYFIELAMHNQGVSWEDISFVALVPDGVALNRDDLHVKGGKPVYFVNHHEAHAASAFYLSPFKESIVLTLDGGGNDGGGLIGFGRDNKIRVDKKIANGAFGILWDISLQLWSRTLQGPIGTEGVLMGASAYGKPIPSLRDYFVKQITRLSAIETDTISSRLSRAMSRLARGGKELQLLPPDFSFDSEESYFDFCRSLQQATDIIIERYFSSISEQYDCPAICLAGGVTLNCNAMGKALVNHPMLQHYSCPAPNDGGLSIGAALWVYYNVLCHERVTVESISSPYLGLSRPDYPYEELLRSVGNLVIERNVSHSALVDMLVKGDIISIYHGRSESGRRALGNRSIIADPRDLSMREKINSKVKHRHWYRPFAPSVLREHVAEIFECDMSSPYMSVAIPIKNEWREKIPAVLHLDGTARLQTVTRSANPFFYELIHQFYLRTGVPLLLNTSFNDNEPIVETPEDALQCFLRTEIDHLYMEGYLATKQKAP